MCFVSPGWLATHYNYDVVEDDDGADSNGGSNCGLADSTKVDCSQVSVGNNNGVEIKLNDIFP